MKKKLTESQLRNIVKEAIKETLISENVFDRLYKAHVPSNKEIANPTVKDVIERNGWLIKGTKPDRGGSLFSIEQKTGAFGNTEGTLSLDELMQDIKAFGKFGKILKRESLFGDKMTNAEKAIIFVQN